MTWVKDESQNWVNSDMIFSLTVDASGGNYVVLGRDAAGTALTTFWNGSAMTQNEADDLRARLVGIFGSFDPTL